MLELHSALQSYNLFVPMCKDHKYKTKTFELQLNFPKTWSCFDAFAEPVVFIHLENKIKNLEVHQDDCVYLCVCVCVYGMCVYVCVIYACVCVCVCVCVHVCVWLQVSMNSYHVSHCNLIHK